MSYVAQSLLAAGITVLLMTVAYIAIRDSLNPREPNR